MTYYDGVVLVTMHVIVGAEDADAAYEKIKEMGTYELIDHSGSFEKEFVEVNKV